MDLKLTKIRFSLSKIFVGITLFCVFLAHGYQSVANEWRWRRLKANSCEINFELKHPKKLNFFVGFFYNASITEVRIAETQIFTGPGPREWGQEGTKLNSDFIDLLQGLPCLEKVWVGSDYSLRFITPEVDCFVLDSRISRPASFAAQNYPPYLDILPYVSALIPFAHLLLFFSVLIFVSKIRSKFGVGQDNKRMKQKQSIG